MSNRTDLMARSGDIFMACSDYPHTEGTSTAIEDYKASGLVPAGELCRLLRRQRRLSLEGALAELSREQVGPDRHFSQSTQYVLARAKPRDRLVGIAKAWPMQKRPTEHSGQRRADLAWTFGDVASEFRTGRRAAVCCPVCGRNLDKFR